MKPPRSSPEITILHEDADFLAVDKPAGMPVIPGRQPSATVRGELEAQLARRDGVEQVKLLVVHRLDMETTGVLLFAKHTAAQRALATQFGKRQVHKTYWVLVRGKPEPESGSVEHAIEDDRKKPGAMRIGTSKGAKASRTDYHVVEEYRGFSLVECHPLTGRTHQIRVHMSSLGCPPAVDPIYGSPEGLRLSDFKMGWRPSRDGIERPLISRLTLHALKVRFKSPGGAEMEIEAPLPRDWSAALQALRKWAAPRRRR